MAEGRQVRNGNRRSNFALIGGYLMTSKEHHPTWTGKQAGLIGIAILLLAGFCFAQTTISLSPKDGPPTTTLRVSGSGFTPYAQIDVYFDSQDEALAVADAAGTFSQIAIQAPKSAVPGNHWVTVAERSGHIAKQEIFEVHVNWTEFHTKDMRRENPYENVLNVNNVGMLHKKGHYKTSSDVISSPAVVNGTLYVGSSNGKIYALNIRTGTKLWSDAIGAPVYSSPAVANGVVYIGSFDGNVYALDAGTGAKLWDYTTGGTVFSSPAVANGVVYVGSYDGNVYALDAQTGANLWSYPVSVVEISSPAVANGVVYIGSYDSNIYALDARTGALLWSYPAGSVGSSPAVADGVVYIGSFDGNLYALDARTGALLWKYLTGSHVECSPAVAYGIVYFGSDDNNLYALDARTGALLWSYPIGGQSSPALANGVVYVGSPFHYLYVLDARTGAPLWSYETLQGVTSSPAVVNGTVYVGSDDYNVYAFGLPNELVPQPPQRPNPTTLRPDFNLRPLSTIATE